MERCGHEFSLSDKYWEAVAAGQYLNLGTGLDNARGANENHFKRFAGKRRWRDEDAGVNLAPVSVSFHDRVERAQAALNGIAHVAREQDSAGAGAERGVGVNEFFQTIKEVAALKESEHRGGLATGKDEAVDQIEFVGIADRHGGSAGFREGGGVGGVIALDGEDTDTGRIVGTQCSSLAKREWMNM